MHGVRDGRRSSGRGALTAALVLLGAGAASGQEVQIRLEPAYVYPGEAAVLHVEITNPAPEMKAPELPAVTGLLIRGPRVSNQTSIVNGQRTQTVVYSYAVQPAGGAQTGKFTLGPATFARRTGAPLQSNTVELGVGKRPPPGIRFQCATTPPAGPAGNPFRIDYTISYGGELHTGGEGFFSDRSPFGIVGLELPVLKLSGLRLKPARSSPGKAATTVNFGDVPLLIEQGFEEDAEGFGWRTLSFGFEATPTGTGTIAIPPAGVRLRLDSGKVRTGRGVFGDPVRVPVTEDYEARTNECAYTVRELPAAGRPEGFTGAVGRYAVQVTASPLEVDAFAPITLEVRVTGQGILEELKPAAWSEVSSLTKDFDVSPDVDSGRMEGPAKVFRQVIRPRHEKVTAIPPVPFPYFDPKLERYEVARSREVPIKVKAAKTIGAGEAIPSTKETHAPGKAVAAVAAISDRSGIGANFREMGAVRSSLDPREEVLSAPFLALVGAPPLVLLGGVLASRALRKDPRRRRREGALSRARGALAGAAGPDDAARAYQDYFRDRFDLGAGELTPAELDAALAARGIDQGLRARAVSLLERLLAGRFGGAGGDPRSIAGEAADTLRAIEGAAGGAA
jgi:hypothetical protein